MALGAEGLGVWFKALGLEGLGGSGLPEAFFLEAPRCPDLTYSLHCSSFFWLTSFMVSIL